MILNKKLLENELIKYYKSASFQSFKRQLSLYGFVRHGKQHKLPQFSHKNFIRNAKSNIYLIKREKQYKPVKAIRLDTEKLKYILHKLHLLKTMRSKLNTELTKEIGLLESLYKFEKLIGRSVITFVLKFLDKLTRIYPDVSKKHIDEIHNTIELLKSKKSKSADIKLNQKEISITLINTLLTTLYLEYNEGKYGIEFREQLNFNNCLLQLERCRFSLEKRKRIKKNKQQPIFTEQKKVSYHISSIEIQSKSKTSFSFEDNMTVFEFSGDEIKDNHKLNTKNQG